MSETEIKVEQTVRIIVTLDTLVSIDIFQRGYYQLKVRCYKKSKSPIGSKRVDGIVTQIYPVDDSDLKEFLDFDKLDKPDKLAGSRSANYEKCTVDHKICNWKCVRASQIENGSSVFLTRPFYILRLGDRIELKTGACFELESSYKLYQSEYNQEDAAILDFELFFHSEIAPDPIEGISIQRKMIKIEGLSTEPILQPGYTQIVFDSIYYSSLDVSIQCIPAAKRIAKRLAKSNMNLASNSWSFRSIVKSLPAFYSGAANEFNSVQLESMEDISHPGGIDLKSFLICQIFVALHTASVDRLWAMISGLFDRKPDINQKELQMVAIYDQLYSNLKNNVDYQVCKHAIADLELIINPFLGKLVDTNPFSGNYEIEETRKNFRTKELKAIHNLCFNVPWEDFAKKSTIDYYKLIPEYRLPTSQIYLKPFVPNDIAVFEIGEKILSVPTDYSFVYKDTVNPVLFVCVHGLMGDSYDLRLFQNKLIQIMNDFQNATSNIFFLFSKSNQGQTFDSLEVMGSRLAVEIADFISEKNLKSPIINFICHSLGGLIGRICLKDQALDQYRLNFDQFITFSTPHLSLILHNHSILQTALSLYQTIYPAEVIDQLYLRDDLDPRRCLLYKLSMDYHLSSFKRILLYSSTLDLYIHLESSLATQLRVNNVDQKAEIYSEMQLNFEKITNGINLHRFVCEFGELGRRSQDGWLLSGDPLGREAHIRLVTSKLLDMAIIQSLFN